MDNINDYIIRDSSIYIDNNAHSLERRSDAALKVGVIRDVIEIKGPDIAYIVEAWVDGKNIPVQCTRAARFGGVYNYEEVTYRGYEPGNNKVDGGLYDFRPGDIVLIAYILGIPGEGVIINSINHPGRPKLYTPEDGVVFESEFNGVNKSINKDGEYIVTFKGLQTNIDALDKPASGIAIPSPEYDTDIGSTYTKFDKTGSWMTSDNSTNEQSIKIDKPSGKIIITSGATTLTIDKSAESYEIKNKKTSFNSTSEFSIKTKKTSIISSQLVEVESTLIKTKGKIQQDGDVQIKGDITHKGEVKRLGDATIVGNIKHTGNTTQTGTVAIAGGLSTVGPTALAGGANPLIYDIVLIMGVGNLGVPVVSSAVVLKTVLTKAT